MESYVIVWAVAVSSRVIGSQFAPPGRLPVFEVEKRLAEVDAEPDRCQEIVDRERRLWARATPIIERP